MPRNNQPIKPMTAVPKRNYPSQTPITPKSTPTSKSEKAPFLEDKFVRGVVARRAKEGQPETNLTPEQAKKLEQGIRKIK